MPSTTVTCRLTAVTNVKSAAASRSYSSAAQGQFILANTTQYGLLQFGLPRDLGNATVISAVIQMRSTKVLTGSRTTSAQLLAGPIRSTTTWKNQPGLLAGSVARAGGIRPGNTTWYDTDVTADLQQVAAGAPYFGHRLRISESTARAFYSRTNSSSYPRLVLTYATETPAPVGMQPSGVVSIAAPTFTWLAPKDVTRVQAQAAPEGTSVSSVDGGFTAPSWTSAELLSSLGQVDTATAGWSGLADAAAALVQVRQYGTLGWSKWSTPARVERDVYAALSVVFPVPGGVTNDPTPPHEWTFPGQAKFQVQILDAADKKLYESGQVAGDDQEWTPTLSTVGIRSGAVLTSVLRVWDDRAGRVASTGDPGYVAASWSWTLNPSADTPPVTNFSAFVQADRPAPILSWGWNGAVPDEFIIERDGVLAQRFDSGDYEVSAGSWRFEDWSCPPNVDVLYSVRAVNGGKMSAAAQVRLVHHRLAGVVIAEPESGAWINIADSSAADGLAKVDTVLMYKGPYAQAPVKRILALGGLEGPLAGILSPIGDRPIEEQVADVETIRSFPTRTCRLVYGLVNVPVLVSGVDPTLASDALFNHLAHRIKMSVAQNGEFDTDATGDDTPAGG